MYSSTQNVFLQIAKYAFSEKHLHSTPLCWNLSVEHFEAQCRPCVEPCLCAIFFCAQIVVELVQCRIWTECRTLQSGAPLPASCFLSAQTEVNVCLLPQSLSHWWSSWFNHRKLQTAIKTTLWPQKDLPTSFGCQNWKMFKEGSQYGQICTFCDSSTTWKILWVSYFCPI